MSLNLDEAQAFRRQPGDEKSLSEVTIVPTAPETSPTLLTRSTFPDAGPAPLRRGEAARQQIAAAEAIAKHGRNSRAPSSPAPIPVSPIPASPFQSQPSGSQASIRASLLTGCCVRGSALSGLWQHSGTRHVGWKEVAQEEIARMFLTTCCMKKQRNAYQAFGVSC